jgi:Transglycosylase SLT domain.
MVKLRDADRHTFPHVASYVQADLRSAIGDARLWSVFREASGMDDPTARDAVTGGIRSPQLVIVALDGIDGRFVPERPGEIDLSAASAERFERDWTRPEAQRFLQSVLLTLLVAWRRARAGELDWSTRASVFQRMAYGTTNIRYWEAPPADSPQRLNAILFDYQPTGASDATAAQDRLTGGVWASEDMARRDAPLILPHRDKFNAAGAAFQLPPALLAGIASRESRGGRALSNGWGDDGHAFGIMQVDKTKHDVLGADGDPASQTHIDQAAGILYANLRTMRTRFAAYPVSRQLQAAVAAYNFGPGNARTLERLDIGSTGNDYSNDVWARATYLAREWW